MKIGEVANQTNLNTSAIRYYEKCGLLTPQYRVGGQRRYANDIVDRVLLIRFASDMGFSIAEIRLFLNGLSARTPVGPRWRRLAQNKIREVDLAMERARRLKLLLSHLLGCRCGSLKICVERLKLSPILPLLHRSRESRGAKTTRKQNL
jgi:MerR family transcriptional regulator, redox-sensitive transcriptional activator SoxR